MSYSRPKEALEPAVLVPLFEKAIHSLVRRFRNHPYAFYTETDMHCYLYHRLYTGGLLNGLYRTAEGHITTLLHKEYPTATRFNRREDGTLEESETGRRRGAFDLCVWDPRFIEENEHRKQKVLCAAELALNECRPGNPHTLNDATKLAGSASEIKYGFLLFFVRNDHSYERNKREIWDNLEDAATRVRVVFAMVDDEAKIKKPKPIYLGDWGKI